MQRLVSNVPKTFSLAETLTRESSQNPCGWGGLSIAESTLIEDRELIHGLLSVMGGPAPFCRVIAQHQPDQFSGSIIAREMPPGLDNFAQLRVDVLDGVSGIDHTAHDRRKGKKRGRLS